MLLNTKSALLYISFLCIFIVMRSTFAAQKNVPKNEMMVTLEARKFGKNSSFEDEFYVVRDENQAKEKDLNALKEYINELEVNFGNAIGLIENTNKTMEKHTKQLAELEEKCSAQGVVIENLQKKCKEKDDKIEEYKVKFAVQEAKIVRLEKKYKKREDDIICLQKEGSKVRKYSLQSTLIVGIGGVILGSAVTRIGAFGHLMKKGYRKK